jgi:hypothetical protein
MSILQNLEEKNRNKGTQEVLWDERTDWGVYLIQSG